VRHDVCNAAAVQLPGRAPAIVVFSGLLKAIMYVLELRLVVADIAKRSAGTPTESMAEADLMLAAYRAKASLAYFFDDGLPLVRIGGVLDADAKRGAMFSFTQALWFVLMHEFGHIKLGHLENRHGPCPATPSLMLGEDLNQYKVQEFDADAYYLGTLRPESRLYALNYVLDVLTIYSFIENHLRQSNRTHPMAINRLQNIVSKYGEHADQFFIERARTVLENELRARDSADRVREDRKLLGKARLETFAAKAETDDSGLRLMAVYAAGKDASRQSDDQSAFLAQLWDHFADRWWDPAAPNVPLFTYSGAD
jgi:hypothetical protein